MQTKNISEIILEEVLKNSHKIEALSNRMDEGFTRVDERFDEMAEQFVKVDEHFREVNKILHEVAEVHLCTGEKFDAIEDRALVLEQKN